MLVKHYIIYSFNLSRIRYAYIILFICNWTTSYWYAFSTI